MHYATFAILHPSNSEHLTDQWQQVLRLPVPSLPVPRSTCTQSTCTQVYLYPGLPQVYLYPGLPVPSLPVPRSTCTQVYPRSTCTQVYLYPVYLYPGLPQVYLYPGLPVLEHLLVLPLPLVLEVRGELVPEGEEGSRGDLLLPRPGLHREGHAQLQEPRTRNQEPVSLHRNQFTCQSTQEPVHQSVYTGTSSPIDILKSKRCICRYRLLALRTALLSEIWTVSAFNESLLTEYQSGFHAVIQDT